MGAGESTNSSASNNRPLTAAERQDLYRSSIGNILNTYTESGLPYGGYGSQDAANAHFDPNGTNGGTWGAALPNSIGTGVNSLAQGAFVGQVQQPTGQQPQSGQQPTGGQYNATGGASMPGGNMTSYHAPLDFFNQTHGAPDPSVNMPTGSADPGGINLPVYQTPVYQSPGAFKAGGYTQGLDYAKQQDIKGVNQDLANRGIWSSGLADQAVKDRQAAYAPAYEKAGADQATAENAYNQQAAGAANAFNQSNVQNQFSAGWAPLNYLSSLWNGTAGNVGGSTSFGQNLQVSV